jgi:hypothetical protein
MKHAISRKVGLFDMTYPQIFVKGTYIGGADDLHRLLEGDGWNKLLQGQRVTYSGEDTKAHVVPLVWYPPTLELSKTPDLFTVPKMSSKGSWYPVWKWYAFQWVMYANLVRYISAIHVILMVTAVALFQAGQSSAGVMVATILGVDNLMLTLWGPAPLSLSGSLSQYFGWKHRGNATSALPYKVIFGFYAVLILPRIIDRASGKVSQEESDDVIMKTCKGIIFNSVLLAVFRF